MIPSRRSRPAGPAAAGLAALLLCGAVPAAAAPYYQAYLYSRNNLAMLQNVFGPNPPQAVATSLTYSGADIVVDAAGSTGEVSVDLDVTGYPPVQRAMESGATARIDDLVITDGTGVPKPVAVYVRLEVAGDVGTATSGNDHNVAYVYAVLKVRVNGVTSSSTWAPSGGGLGDSGPSTGVFTGMSAASVQGGFQIGPFNLQTEQANTLEIQGIVTAGPYAESGWMQASCRFESRLRQSGPAIVMPAGFFANSTQGRIVNNWFVGQNVSVPGPAGGTTAAIELAPAAPNPFSDHTRLDFALGRPGRVSAAIFSVAGRRVVGLLDDERGAGRHSLRWDGRDGEGRKVPPGVYLLSLEANGERTTRRITLQR